MTLSLLLGLKMLAKFHYPAGGTVLDETSCTLPCQHPSCWASQRRQEKGVPLKLPPIGFNKSALNEETDLPMQSILNLLSEYGQSKTDGCPGSPEEGYSHHSYTKLLSPKHPVPSSSIGCQQRSTRSRERNTTSKPTSGQATNTPLHVVEVADSTEPCVGNQLYVWLSNSKKMPGNLKSRSLEDKNPNHPLIKDMTECMMPEEVDQKRQSSILFADWPTLKKKRAYSRRQRKLSTKEKTVLSLDTIFSGFTNPQSHDTSHRQLSPALYKKPSRSQSGDAREILNTRSAELLREHKENFCDQDLHKKPTVNLDESSFSHSLVPNRDIRHRSRHTLQDSYKRREPTLSSHQTTDCHSKVTSISLGLPQFSVPAQRARQFSYGRQDFGFSLGPVPMTRYQSRFDQDYSDQVPRVESILSATLLLQQTSSNPHADEFILDSGSPRIEMQVKVYEAAATSGSLRSSPSQELQLVQHPPDNRMASEPVTDTWSDLQLTTARRHTEVEVADRVKSSLDDDEATVESPAPPPPSPEPRV